MVALSGVDIRPGTDRANATLDIDAPKGPQRWLLAESTWDNVIGLPSFWSILRWAIVVTPWVLLTQLWAPVVIRYRTARAEHPDLDYFAALDTPVLVRALLAVVLTPIGSVLIAGFAVILVVVSIIPLDPIRGFVQRAQRWVSGFLGDLYTLLERPMDAAAMTSKVQSDIDWLVTQGAPRVAVIAHSQGGAVAYLALRQKLQQEVKLFYTFGSGVARLEEAARLLAQPWSLIIFAFLLALFLSAGWYLVVSPVSKCGLDSLCAIGSIEWGPIWTYGPIIFGGLGGIFLGWSVKPLGGPASPLRWVDSLASSDPVLADRSGRFPKGVILRRVSNFKSPLTDHQSYWDNRDEFVTDVVRELGELSDLTILADPQDELAMEHVSRRREWRVGWLILARLVSIVAMVGLLWAFRRELPTWGDQILDVASWVLSLLPTWLVGGALEAIPDKGAVLSELLGAVPIIGIAMASYKVLFRVWRLWDGADLQRMFKRQGIDSGGFWFGSYLAACGVAAGGVTIAIQSGSLERFLTNLSGGGRVLAVALWVGIALFMVWGFSSRVNTTRLSPLTGRIGALLAAVGSAITAVSVRPRWVRWPGPYANGAVICVVGGLLGGLLMKTSTILNAPTAGFVFVVFICVLAFTLIVQAKAWLPWKALAVLGVGLAIAGCSGVIPSSVLTG